MRSWRTWLIVVLFGLVLAFSAWLQEFATRPLAPTVAVGRVPDHVLEGYRVALHSTDGSPRYRLSGPRLSHYPDEDSAELEAPSLTLYEAGSPAWTADAEHGTLTNGADRVLLGGAVTLRRLPAPGVTALQIETRDLRLEPDRDLAETDQPVHITGEHFVVDAIGLRVRLVDGSRVIELLSQVRGRHDPIR